MTQLVEIPPVGIERLREVLSPGEFASLDEGAAVARRSSTAASSGTSTRPPGRRRRRDAAPAPRLRARRRRRRRWVVIEGDAGVLRGDQAHPQPPARRRGRRRRRSTSDARRIYERVLERERRGLRRADRRRGDVVILHDPQTAGLVAPLRAAGATVDLALPRRHRRRPTTSRARRGRSCAATSRTPTSTSSRARRSPGRASTASGSRHPAVDRRVLAQEPGPRRRHGARRSSRRGIVADGDGRRRHVHAPRRQPGPRRAAGRAVEDAPLAPTRRSCSRSRAGTR